MKVLKFGGTSVGTVDSLKNVKKIVESLPGKAIIVVSALGGLTDKLIAMAKMASEGNPDWEKEMKKVYSRHFDIINHVVPLDKIGWTKVRVDFTLDTLEMKYDKIASRKELSEIDLNYIVSFGERLSSIIIAAMIENGKLYDSRDFIFTEKWYGKNIADRKLTDKMIKKTFSSMGENEKAIVPGFISTDSSTGYITNLGRGGSDFTGALIAAALNAEILEIWTDVDGFMTADPRIVKNALIIDHLTFTESMELCTFGAKVIYPPTIYPVFHSNIPIKILNTFNPSAPGTLITDNAKRDDLDIKGVTALKDLSIIRIEVKEPKKIKDPLKRALNALSKQGITIIPVANPDPDSELNLVVSNTDSKVSLDLIRKEFATEIADNYISASSLKDNLAAIAVVGKDMNSRGRLAARIGHSLRRQGINVEAYSVGSSTTLLYIINQEKCSFALSLIHSLIF